MSIAMSIVFYFIVFGISATILHFGLKRRFKPLIIMSLMIPVLVSGLRYNVGTDYASYVDIFDYIKSHSFNNFSDTYQRMEIGFVGLNNLAYFISRSPTMLFILSSTIIIFFFFLGIKRYEINHKALIYFTFLVTVFPITFNAVRQGIAMAIAFYAFTYILSRQPLRFTFWVVVASLFHVTALLLLPVYLLNYVIKKNMAKTYYRVGIKIAISSVIFLLLLPAIINSVTEIDVFKRYDVYLNSDQASSLYLIYIKVFVISIIAVFYKRIIALNPANIYYFTFAIIDLGISTIGFSSYELYRVTYYFSLFNIFLLVSVIDIFKVGSQKRLLMLGVIIYSILYFCYAYYSLGSNDILPYSWQV